MAENKTQPTESSVTAFLQSIDNEQKREDCFRLLETMEQITNEAATMWGDSLVGFGQYHYKYASGREGDFFITGFSPRKQNLTIYIMPGFKKYTALLEKLGKHKTSVSCLYIKSLKDIDFEILKMMIADSVVEMKRLYPS